MLPCTLQPSLHASSPEGHLFSMSAPLPWSFTAPAHSLVLASWGRGVLCCLGQPLCLVSRMGLSQHCPLLPVVRHPPQDPVGIVQGHWPKMVLCPSSRGREVFVPTVCPAVMNLWLCPSLSGGRFYLCPFPRGMVSACSSLSDTKLSVPSRKRPGQRQGFCLSRHLPSPVLYPCDQSGLSSVFLPCSPFFS